MSNATATIPAAMTADELDRAIADLPQYSRTFHRVQGAASLERDAERGRKFTIGGAKGDAVAAYLIAGGYTRSEIAEYVGCSVSRVGEVAWGLEAAGIKFDVVKRRKVEAAEADAAE
jgi:hypothetical protein